MVTDRIAAACVQHRSEVVASFWEVRESGWTLSHLDLNTHDCQRSLMTAIPCKTITSILGLVGPETVRLCWPAIPTFSFVSCVDLLFVRFHENL
jgi:hypothetical protein